MAEQLEAAASEVVNPSDSVSQSDALPSAITDKFAEVMEGNTEAEPDNTGKPEAKPATGSNRRQAQQRQQAAAGNDEGLDEGQDPDQQTKDGQEKPANQQPAPQEADATLPPVLRQAARRAGWNDTQIDRLYQADPELAEQTFQQMHSSVNALSARFAQLGQAKLSAGSQAPAQQQQQVQLPADPMAALFDQKWLDNFANTVDGGEELVAKVLKPLADSVLPQIKEFQQFVQEARAEATQKEFSLFFKGIEGDFTDVYGKGEPRALSEEQRSARYAVAQQADLIRAGAAEQGIPMSVTEALEQAHLLTTAPRAKEQARKQLTGEVRARANQITARPSQRRTPRTVPDGASRSVGAAENAVADFWASRGQE